MSSMGEKAKVGIAKFIHDGNYARADTKIGLLILFLIIEKQVKKLHCGVK